MNKKYRAILVISLLLNIFFISVAAGRILNSQHIQSPALNTFLQTIPAEARPVLREHIKPHRRELVKAVYQLRQGRKETARLLSEPELDAEALEATMREVRSHLSTSIEILQQGTLKAMQEMPNEVRLEWAQQWQQQDHVSAETMEWLNQTEK